MTPVRMDNKGRLVIPRPVREALNLRAGDVFVVEAEPEGDVFRVARARNPFDVMAEYAIREFEAGRTTDLRDYAARKGYVINDDGTVSRQVVAGSREGSGEAGATGGADH
ncbi:MAG: AbrB/MazE/SpoVT family DNA-binding domain-containing protein [Chloroflexia bacterium]|nr:AbrB/MazE/SpoVT family DNA-binding domain-containing protein [Chloroflexia bacterium]